jgi:hypothetical protein
MPNHSHSKKADSRQLQAISRITVAGFKSIRDEQSVEVRPLTILAGANSSGKSSIMQPLLLMKQTLEAPYDPGALLLNGPNVRFTRTNQFLSRTDERPRCKSFNVGLKFEHTSEVVVHFDKKNRVTISQIAMLFDGIIINLSPEMSSEDIGKQIPTYVYHNLPSINPNTMPEWEVERRRCFLDLFVTYNARDTVHTETLTPPFVSEAIYTLQNIIHLPALRGNPQRNYQVADVGDTFAGTFDNYFASVIVKWQNDNNLEALKKVGADLQQLGLTRKVAAKRINDAEVEIGVERLIRKRKSKEHRWDRVSIADAGFGISQILPVIIALHIARPKQMVYIEQPEIHLHPRAQVALTEVIADAVNRGVIVVMETQSSLLLLGFQTLVANGKILPESAKLHWFTRSESDGVTTIKSADFDDAGAFGDWPEDFGQVESEIESRYLDAAEARMSKR